MNNHNSSNNNRKVLTLPRDFILHSPRLSLLSSRISICCILAHRASRFLQFYIICEAIYFVMPIKAIGPTCPKLIYRSLYIIFGTLDFELLLWTSLSLVMWLVIIMCLLVFALASSDLLTQGFDHFLEIVKLLVGVLSS